MCGISGIILKKNTVNISLISEYLLKQLYNRGPDNSSYYIHNNNISLCHNRLSINDLDERSNQPFFYENLVLVFNGEIYNFNEMKEYLIEKYGCTFDTTSDTEVLIKMYYFEGDEGIIKLNGIFAFAILDKNTNKIEIYRDKVGIKFCYYYEDQNLFIFASNPAAIARTISKFYDKKWNVNINSIFSYLSSGICLSQTTLFEGINGINPCEKIIYEEKFGVTKWYNYNFERSTENIENIIEKVIDNQEIGNVKSFTLYSGGIDSCVLGKYSKKSELLTLDLGELDKAIFSADIFNKKIRKIEKSLLDKYVKNFIDEQRKIISFTGIPCKASYIMNLSGLWIKENSPENKILLTGIGGNELFYGHRRMKVEDKGFKSHLRDLYIFLNQIKPLENNVGEKFKEYKKNIEEIIRKEIDIPENLKKENASRWLEIRTFLLNDLLLNADTIYMYYSIESRVPLLDLDIFEICLSKTPNEFFKNFDLIMKNPTWRDYTDNSKKMLKDCIRNELGEEYINKEKFSYDVERHTLHPYYIDICKKFLERNIVSWNGDFTKYNSPLVGNLEIWFQEFEDILNLQI